MGEIKYTEEMLQFLRSLLPVFKAAQAAKKTTRFWEEDLRATWFPLYPAVDEEEENAHMKVSRHP